MDAAISKWHGFWPRALSVLSIHTVAIVVPLQKLNLQYVICLVIIEFEFVEFQMGVKLKFLLVLAI